MCVTTLSYTGVRSYTSVQHSTSALWYWHWNYVVRLMPLDIPLKGVKTPICFSCDYVTRDL